MYLPEFEHDSCGFGLLVNIDGQASHWVLQKSMMALAKMQHRGAIAADGKSGDGCGILFALDHDWFRQQVSFDLPTHFAVGMVFLSQNETKRQHEKAFIAAKLSEHGLALNGWRTLPVNDSCLGEQALSCQPHIEQMYVSATDTMLQGEALERQLYQARRAIELNVMDDPDVYIASLSAHTIVYKALVMPENLPHYFLDLQDDSLKTKLCVFHQRFSTNTTPQWRLAQPFRLLAHNGEINTIKGNRNWTIARGPYLKSDVLPNIDTMLPIVSHHDSDSCSFDNMLELLRRGGMSLYKAVRILMPPAWQNMERMDPDFRAFCDYYAMHMEPWDGPAGLVMTDGRYALCALDRNGLRPARWVQTQDRHMVIASEVGVYDYAPEQVLAKGRVPPGEMLVVDTQACKVLFADEINQQLQQAHPYKQWLRAHSRRLRSKLTDGKILQHPMPAEQRLLYQKLFQLSFEEHERVIQTLAQNGREEIGSMGDDAPLAVLSGQPRSLYDYFRQQFAQVTNPPIDPLRESIAMSLETYFGGIVNLFDDSEQQAQRVVVDSPILSEPKFLEVLSLADQGYPHCVLDLNIPQDQDWQQAIAALQRQALQAIEAGNNLLILDDSQVRPGHMPLHVLLATGAIHHGLIQAQKRCCANIIVKTATVRDSHHCAVLLGYGATAIFPYLAYECLHEAVEKNLAPLHPTKFGRYYRRGLKKGLRKILSKMGISCMASYRGAQLFEAVGLDQSVVDLCFTGTVSRIGGATFADLRDKQQFLVNRAWKKQLGLYQGGRYKFVYDGEYHAYHPGVIYALQQAVTSGKPQDYEVFADLVNRRPPAVLRDLLHLKQAQQPLVLEQVESVEAILSRFDSAGMSLGALSPEAHETLAMAMNQLGGCSNSGEGGEDPARYGTDRVSKIKQIASGRFGVTPEYLVNAEVLQIKIAQGAKPGEGGQLPGHKVTGVIAKLRYAKEGVSLISPPPHHDIYSIEDLAQLIFDLKQINHKALVSVKLVSEAGVGTIAVGVAKAYADLITIAGYDGGTGASPLTSVVYAGSPWELGLSEVQQALRMNGLRQRVRIQADGGLKTGLDVIKAAILGAESFGFGTAPMVAMGCKYLRICHLNNCATGVATQDKTLRENHFTGTADKVKRYFYFVAEEVRQWLAYLGMEKLADVIGRVDLLDCLPGKTKQQQQVDLSPLLRSEGDPTQPHTCQVKHNAPYDEGVLERELRHAITPAIHAKRGGKFDFAISNQDRSIGASLSGIVARMYGNTGMDDAPIHIRFTGSAGQSFGVWNAGGLHLSITGDANDYVGKGMAGGKIVIHPPQDAQFASQDTVIMGNTCLYGATGGTLYAAGLAGERFAVRNSGATAVIEGAGDHCCEYMTGGTVVVLGETGVNFGAGMTGGIAFVYDAHQHFVDRYNHELIDIHRIATESMEPFQNILLALLETYVAETQSAWGQELLDYFEDYVGRFWLVEPKTDNLHNLMETIQKGG